MLDVEAALARACAAAGLIPAEAAEKIAAACEPERFDAALLGREAALSAQPAVPLASALREVSEWAHHGATSQDVMDSAAMLVAKRALVPVLDDAAAAAGACAELAERHAETPMMARTLLQAAQPTTFGLKAAGWMSGLDDARRELARVREEALAVQLGGAAGTQAAYGERAPQVVAALARELGLAEPVLPWHAQRERPARLAAALGVLAGTCGKIARDVALLAQTEVGEVRERPEEGRGGSSSMPHKQNPVAAVSAVACATRVPGLVATMVAAMEGEHERAAGAWQAEWETLSDLLRLTGAAAAWTRDMLDRLVVDANRMRANLAGARPENDAAAALVRRALAARRGE